jgi:hypothetical protein
MVHFVQVLLNKTPRRSRRLIPRSWDKAAVGADWWVLFTVRNGEAVSGGVVARRRIRAFSSRSGTAKPFREAWWPGGGSKALRASATGLRGTAADSRILFS